MEGHDGQFRAPMDVYAFTVCCAEILTNGTSLWLSLNDEAVRTLVLSAFAFTQFPVLIHLQPSAIQRRTADRTSQITSHGRRTSPGSLNRVGSRHLPPVQGFLRSWPVLK